MATLVVPIGDYLRNVWKPDAEYVDGAVEERAVGEYDHSSWQTALLIWLNATFRQHGFHALGELRIQVSETRYRVPDVALLDSGRPVEQIPSFPPVAVIEILSPEDSLRRVKDRLHDFAQMGVPNIFLVDPAERIFYRYLNSELQVSAGVAPLAGTPGVLDWEGVAQFVR